MTQNLKVTIKKGYTGLIQNIKQGFTTFREIKLESYYFYFYALILFCALFQVFIRSKQLKMNTKNKCLIFNLNITS